MAHEMTLLSAEVRAANEALSKRRKAKKSRICQEGALIIKDAQDMIARKEVKKEVQRNIRVARSNRKDGQLFIKHYKAYEKTSHNAQTYPNTIEVVALTN